jgi:hypothetical protein
MQDPTRVGRARAEMGHWPAPDTSHRCQGPDVWHSRAAEIGLVQVAGSAVIIFENGVLLGGGGDGLERCIRREAECARLLGKGLADVLAQDGHLLLERHFGGGDPLDPGAFGEQAPGAGAQVLDPIGRIEGGYQPARPVVGDG